MKKTVLLLAFFWLSVTVFAQETDETESKSKHNISVEYGIYNVTDFGQFIGSAIAGFDDHFIYGDISINYGYEVNRMFETGLVANFAVPNDDYIFFTFMPRAKLNFNSDGFINPYVELDAGLTTTNKGGAMFIFHGTLFGLEIGHFYFQILGWGQRGLFYAGYKYQF